MYTIRLSKKNKTIKVVNRRNNLRLQRIKESLRLRHTGRTGPRGPAGPTGPTGPTGVSTFVRSHHGADPNVARPLAVFVEWVGSIAPLNATAEDTWIHTQ